MGGLIQSGAEEGCPEEKVFNPSCSEGAGICQTKQMVPGAQRDRMCKDPTGRGSKGVLDMFREARGAAA